MVYRIYLDGHEELVRNLNINGLTLANFKDIVAVSDTLHVYSAPYRNRRISPATRGSFLVGAPPGVGRGARAAIRRSHGAASHRRSQS